MWLGQIFYPFLQISAFICVLGGCPSQTDDPSSFVLWVGQEEAPAGGQRAGERALVLVGVVPLCEDSSCWAALPSWGDSSSHWLLVIRFLKLTVGNCCPLLLLLGPLYPLGFI